MNNNLFFHECKCILFNDYNNKEKLVNLGYNRFLYPIIGTKIMRKMGIAIKSEDLNIFLERRNNEKTM